MTKTQVLSLEKMCIIPTCQHKTMFLSGKYLIEHCRRGDTCYFLHWHCMIMWLLQSVLPEHRQKLKIQGDKIPDQIDLKSGSTNNKNEMKNWQIYGQVDSMEMPETKEGFFSKKHN